MSEYLIKTKEAITRCFECPFRDGLFCLALDEKPINKYRGVQTRESFCPLVEVLPHGELVQRSDIIGLFDENNLSARKAVMKAPTIIEASCENS